MWFVYTNAPTNTIIISISVQLIALLFALINVGQVKKFIKTAEKVCVAGQKGDFDQRIVMPSAKGDIKRVADKINSLIDVNDAFVRESSLALTAASEGRFYRKIRPEGMLGMFSYSVSKINHAIDAMEMASKARSDIISALRDQIGGTVEAAIAGDFTKRLQVQREEDEFSIIAKQVNDLIGVVNRGLTETGKVLSALAHEDLTLRVEGSYRGDFLKLKQDTNLVAENLSRVIGQLRETSGSLRVATSEILEGANDLSERTLRQAATIEETSATMEQLSNTVAQSALQANDANAQTVKLSKTAEESGIVVENATDAMQRITQSSEKISNVIGMIDDIAFQTNLLALNASVEAARAGEDGKGFAVVAVEVRRLAQSAAEAAKQVKQLIEESAKEVKQGSKFVGDVSQNLLLMISAIKSNGEVMQILASNSHEQAASIDEVNSAVRQMDEITQQNAALVEQTNAAIEQTDNQVHELDNIVDVFKMELTPEEIEHKRKIKEAPPPAHNRRKEDKLVQGQKPNIVEAVDAKVA